MMWKLCDKHWMIPLTDLDIDNFAILLLSHFFILKKDLVGACFRPASYWKPPTRSFFVHRKRAGWKLDLMKTTNVVINVVFVLYHTNYIIHVPFSIYSWYCSVNPNRYNVLKVKCSENFYSNGSLFLHTKFSRFTSFMLFIKKCDYNTK